MAGAGAGVLACAVSWEHACVAKAGGEVCGGGCRTSGSVGSIIWKALETCHRAPQEEAGAGAGAELQLQSSGAASC